MNLKSLLKRYTVDQLKEAIRLGGQQGKIDALKAKRDVLRGQLQKVERKLAKLIGNEPATTTAKPNRPGRRKGFKVSPATRRKMAEAARRRYAGKGKTEAAEPGKPERKRRKLSAAGRAAIAAAARARWERARQAKSQPVAEAKTE